MDLTEESSAVQSEDEGQKEGEHREDISSVQKVGWHVKDTGADEAFENGEPGGPWSQLLYLFDVLFLDEASLRVGCLSFDQFFQVFVLIRV